MEPGQFSGRRGTLRSHGQTLRAGERKTGGGRIARPPGSVITAGVAPGLSKSPGADLLLPRFNRQRTPERGGGGREENGKTGRGLCPARRDKGDGERGLHTSFG